MEPSNIDCKVIIVGNSSVGKTSFTHMYAHNTFPATLGGAYTEQIVQHQGSNIVLQIWDTAGQERLRGMVNMFFRGSHVAIIMFDIGDIDSFESVNEWLTEVQKYAPNAFVIIAGNKADTVPKEHFDQIMALAEKYGNIIGAQVFATSAKTGQGIQPLFSHLVSEYYQRYKNNQVVQGSKAGIISLDHTDEKQKKDGCC